MPQSVEKLLEESEKIFPKKTRIRVWETEWKWVEVQRTAEGVQWYSGHSEPVGTAHRYMKDFNKKISSFEAQKLLDEIVRGDYSAGPWLGSVDYLA